MNHINKYLIACIALSLLGIILIAVVDFKENVAITKISEITDRMAGESIIACGVVKSKSISPSQTAFITLTNESASIRTVFFKNELREVEDSSRGSNLCVKGNIQVYNGTLEIVGRKVINQ